MTEGVLGVKPGHDGGVAWLKGSQLLFSLEGEKDSFPRYSPLTSEVVRVASEMVDEVPSLVAWGGWFKYLPGYQSRIGAGYRGLEPGPVVAGRFFGSQVLTYETSHERTHLFAAAAMAKSAPLEEATILLWEGEIGALYDWRRFGTDLRCYPVLSAPGGRYCALYGLADPSFPPADRDPPAEAAGKLMALAAFAEPDTATREEREAVDRLMDMRYVYPFAKEEFRGSPLFDCGVEDPALHRAARYLTDSIFYRFEQAIERHHLGGRPLLISGGCGLNCEWNSRFRDSGMFSEVSVSPCANDSGSAIGAAVDGIATVFGEKPRLEWSVYSGATFVWDSRAPIGWLERGFDAASIARVISSGKVVAWVEGRAEIGPRALGHRSLLADPRTATSRDLLNGIKKRESYRPVAPCCLEDELGTWFSSNEPDRYMLYFSHVSTDGLPGITHVDGSARVQSVDDTAGDIAGLLRAFGRETGFSVLCNTSLNFSGAGFINRASELFAYCKERGVGQVVVDGRWFEWTAP